MGSRDLDRSVELVLGRHVIDERSGAQSQIIYFSAGIQEAAQYRLVQGGRREPHIASQQDAMRIQQFGKEVTHLVGNLQGQVGSEVTADVVGVKGIEFHIVIFCLS